MTTERWWESFPGIMSLFIVTQNSCCAVHCHAWSSCRRVLLLSPTITPAHDKNTDKSLRHRHVYCTRKCPVCCPLMSPVCRWWFHYKHFRMSQMSVHMNTTVKRGLNNTVYLNTHYTCESWLGNVHPPSPPHSTEAWNSSPSPYLCACPCTCPWSQSARRSCRTAQRWASGPSPPDCVGSARWRVWWRRAPSLGRWCGENRRHCLGQDARWTCREWAWVRERMEVWMPVEAGCDQNTRNGWMDPQFKHHFSYIIISWTYKNIFFY